MFIGRTKELEKLSELYASSGLEYALIYGRRRIGKSEIIKESLKKCGSRAILYICKQTSERNNVESLSEIIAETFDMPTPYFKSMEETLEYLYKRSLKEEMIVILDEYPFLRKNIDGLDSILQSLYERYHDSSKLKLILCGSYIDVMKSLLDESNPLYGRISLVLHIKEQDYYESSLYYPSYSLEDKVLLYSVFGGVPFYNAKINERKSALNNILDLIVDESAPLEGEISIFLKNEIGKIEWANTVLETIARGKKKYADILDASHISSSPTLSTTLESLMKMEIIEKEAPINDESNKKKAKYRIKDNLTLFYYTYIYPNLSTRSILTPKDFFKRIVEEDFESRFVPRAFETILRQYLIRQNMEGKMDPPILKIGRYYYDDPINKRNGEFDVVTFDELGYSFYEAKYQKDKLSRGEIEKEIKQVNETGLKCHRYGFLAKAGFAEKISSPEIFYITLEDLYRFPE